jgi:4-hydroxy-4-methyl-2-oxoglutarate aldolase
MGEETMAELTKELLDELGQLQSCAVANAIETFDVRPRNEGFMSPEVRCMFPELGGMIGYAVTGVIRAGRAPTARMQVSRLDWVDEVLKVPEPRVIVLQDLDAPNPVGSFWGEVQSNVHRALGCVGTVTDGGVRDLDEMRALNFRAFASQPLVSHAYVHLVDANVPVTVGGLTVNTGDLILGDQHGVTNIPMDIAAEVPAEVRRLEASEREMIDVCQAPDFTVEKLKAMIRSRYYAGSEPQKDTVDILREIRDSLNRTLRRNAPPQGRRRATAAARPAPNRRARRMVTDSEGRQVARVDYIRELAGQGLTRGQIARQLEVPYQTVYAATRRITVRSAAEARAGARAQAAEADDTAEE